MNDATLLSPHSVAHERYSIDNPTNIQAWCYCFKNVCDILYTRFKLEPHLAGMEEDPRFAQLLLHFEPVEMFSSQTWKITTSVLKAVKTSY